MPVWLSGALVLRGACRRNTAKDETIFENRHAIDILSHPLTPAAGLHVLLAAHP
jgi:hypothetical protein